MGGSGDTSQAEQIGVYGEYGQIRQSIGAYLEPISNIDPFGGAGRAGAGPDGRRQARRALGA
ncbi:MAG: hypothetical protein WDM85_05890 [Caulobacteraceae bacterium]